ncbi:GNAT family N-acetyltransferase [Cryobacterium sp. PAMC25264]|uniref:GNAT family N-acetyltransferase n=1 Tax=Cryobacterium sp. PAMC25264 TaxID=2861288 RepID=UPI001C628097|nr:GNAT family N-acetyltransferase [Cryobacterium sp. PAMC25264]QYF73651.1 N-acetyltransferase [Cryobacterium sp. PAMC25264]
MSMPTQPEGGAGGEVRTVELVEDERRYVLLLDGERAGSTTYVDHGAQRVFVHTEIDMNQSGKGLGSTLVAGALADVRARQLRAVAICPFTAAYLRGHREYDDIVDPVTPRLKADLREAHLL